MKRTTAACALVAGLLLGCGESPDAPDAPAGNGTEQEDDGGLYGG